MSDHPNATLLRLLYTGQREEFFRHLAPEYVVHVPGHGSGTGHFKGREGHLKHGAMLREMTNNSIRLQLYGSFLADDHWGFVPSRVIATRNGKELDQQAFGLWRFHEGMVAEHWTMPADHQAFNAFFT